MRLHSIICVSAIAAIAATASATTDYYSAPNTFCRLAVASSKASTIVAIPFSNCGGAEGQIFVTNLVMTTGLAVDDTLLYNDGTGWYAWEIKNVGGQNVWQSVDTSTKKGGVNVTSAAGVTTLDCGRACWLVRGDTSKSNPIYLYGQVNSAKTDVTIAAGDGSKPTYTIVACPSEAADFNITTIAGYEGDTVILPSATDIGKIEYKYTGGAWKKPTAVAGDTVTLPDWLGGGTTTVTNTVWAALEAGDVKTVPAGTGFMYGRVKNEALTLTWGD